MGLVSAKFRLKEGGGATMDETKKREEGLSVCLSVCPKNNYEF